MSRSSLGSVYTTWKYATGSSSASRSASHSLAAAPWHLGPCRLRQELYAITVWPQASFSQRATWPPSATVRQRSIALITFNWSRLTCPRLASRQSGTVVAKDIRDLQSCPAHLGGASAAGSGLCLFLGRWCVPPSCASGLSM